MRPQSRIQEESHGGFTSMIDIVFLLLIFFILQPFRMPEMKLPAEMKTVGPGGGGIDRFPVRVEMLPAGADGVEYRVNQHACRTVEQLRARLQEAAREDRKTRIILAPKRRVHVNHVITALDTCYATGLKNVGWEKPTRLLTTGE